MSADNPAASSWGIAVRVIASTLLVGFATRAPLAQQPAAGGSVHVVAPREGRRSNQVDIRIRLLSRRPMAPAKDRPVLLPGSNIVDRNAIGIPVPRHDLAPAAPLVGPVAVRPLARQSAGGLPVKSGEIAPVRVTGAPPLVASRGTISGVSFTRPGTALVPLGGPAKPAATGINGTNVRPRH